jgi:hypothetical protein
MDIVNVDLKMQKLQAVFKAQFLGYKFAFVKEGRYFRIICA